jgi:hypothetical protein
MSGEENPMEEVIRQLSRSGEDHERQSLQLVENLQARMEQAMHHQQTREAHDPWKQRREVIPLDHGRVTILCPSSASDEDILDMLCEAERICEQWINPDERKTDRGRTR